MLSVQPTARRENLNLRRVNNELLGFDTIHEQGNVLNPTAAVIWQLAEGTTYRYKIQVVYLDNHTEWTAVVKVGR